ncbi:dihydropteroate synthase [Rhodobacter calidifons]|uniref:Dihydropteroate synthase n=1 Tax=Rhodobacter calidifons TaxID=2715277 RepID=A0ABX0G761_9RHOB|nr:dihydropteroate synthase [Rhodobacter calidifons]NHB76708.1 dihydropteroate synthase [Rhodobacter calidifons]
MEYFRPIAMTDAARPAGAFVLAGGWCWFDRVEVLSRAARGRLIPASKVPPAVLHRLTAPRPAFAGLTLDRPRLMGILNVTPDSFSDGGRFLAPEAAQAQAEAMAGGAEIIDVGGESTRPGALEVPQDAEIARTVPVIRALRAGGLTMPISIDTRKSGVAAAALEAGATIVNDVSAFDFDPLLGPLVARTGVPVVLMHAQGVPASMQDDPRYDDVLLDVYDALAQRLARAEALGIGRDRIVLDPGIGFGKTLAHNLALLRGLSLFHALGCPLLLGTSRKRFIGSIGRAEAPETRAPGSIATALAGVAQGVQITRVHDVAETRQALRLWQSLNTDHLEGEA